MKSIYRILTGIITFLYFISLQSCNDNDEPISSGLRPSLSNDSTEIIVGECDTLHVLDAEAITSATAHDTPIIDIKTAGLNIFITALKEGKTIVDILADGTRLQCMVKVSERPIPPYDFSKELSDNRCRFSSQSLTLYYDTPGNIFSIWDNRKIEIINLDSLHHILFDAKENITTNGQQLSPTLTINNIEIPISEATVEEHSTRGTWFNILTESHERIVIAITNL